MRMDRKPAPVRDLGEKGSRERVRFRRRLGTWLVLAGLLGAVLGGVAWQHVPGARLELGGNLPLADIYPLGANFFLEREVELWKQEKTLEMARSAGIGWIKQQFLWQEIEPERKGDYRWEKYDRIVALAERYGLRIIARLDRTPAWARGPERPYDTCPPAELDDFGDFVHAFVQRYRGQVQFVQIWNEPNLSAEWCFERVDAVAYTHLLEIAYRAAKRADPGVVVLSAPLAPTLEDRSLRGNHNDLVYLQEMYDAGAGRFFDVLSANAFGLDRPPEDPPDPGVLNFRRVELQRQIMERNADASKPIWIHEYGWHAAPATFPEELLIWKRVTLEQQADYTVRGIDWARDHWPWLGVVNIWYFRQAGDIPPDWAAYYFAMVDPEFNPLPVYEAVRRYAQGIESAEPAAGVLVALLGWWSLCGICLVAGYIVRARG